jgi:hypothetical protein
MGEANVKSAPLAYVRLSPGGEITSALCLEFLTKLGRACRSQRKQFD